MRCHSHRKERRNGKCRSSRPPTKEMPITNSTSSWSSSSWPAPRRCPGTPVTGASSVAPSASPRPWATGPGSGCGFPGGIHDPPGKPPPLGRWGGAPAISSVL
jgi:hypothetical protein